MELLRRVAGYQRIFGAVGLVHAARSYFATAPVEISFAPPGLDHPLHVRLKTTDLSTYLKVFVEREYDFELAAEPRVIVDAGANVGLAAVRYARRYPAARILALEPEPSNFRLLQRNAAPYPAIVPVHAALWSSVGEVAMVDPGLGHWAFRTEALQPAGGAAVPALTVDRLLSAHGVERVDLLKIDVEGAESEIFRDPGAWIGQVDAIAIELHDRMVPGCSRAVFAATGDFRREEWRGENLLLTRTAPARPADHRP